MDDIPDVPVPHRFNDESGRHAFPHAVRAIRPGETGEKTYELQKDRKTTLSFKFNRDGIDSDVLLRLSLEIQEDGKSWKRCLKIVRYYHPLFR